MHAIILSVGDELVLGQTVDTNSAYLSAALAELGIGTLYHQTVADDQVMIARAIRQAAGAADVVLVTGGLGPTDDDLTRQALADALGVELAMDEPSVAAIRQHFTRRGRSMPERNKVQALHPRGSVVIPNDCGTAPGIKARLGGATVYVTPGVPSELFAMFAQAILPELRGRGGSRHVILTATVHTFGMGESSVADRLGELCRRDRNPLVGTTVGDGVVSVRIRSEFPDADEARRQLEESVVQVEQRLGPVVFGRDGQSLAAALITLMQDRGLTLCSAESCTGGLLGKMLTDVPGSGNVYLGGWVTYSYAMKSAELGVEAKLLEERGAVNEAVALAMARGAAGACGADMALAVTGVAGPERGGEPEPVGAVWIGLAMRGQGANDWSVQAIRLMFPGDRAAVRDRAAKSAMQWARLTLLGEPPDLLFAAAPTGQSAPAISR